MADTTETTIIEQAKVIKDYGEGREIIFRKNLDRPLTADEVDNNFKLIPDIMQKINDYLVFSFERFGEMYDKKDEIIEKNTEDISDLVDGFNLTRKTIEHSFEESGVYSVPLGDIIFHTEKYGDDHFYRNKKAYINLSLKLNVEVYENHFVDFVEFIPNILIDFDEIKEEQTIVCSFFRFVEDGNEVSCSLVANLKDSMTVLLSFVAGVHIKEFEAKLSFDNSILFNDTDEEIIVE